jgi:hypothetical protein
MWLKIYIGLQVKYPLFLSDFNETWVFSTCFRKPLKYQILLKFLRWDKLFHADGQADRRTDMTKSLPLFPTIRKRPKTNYKIIYYCSIIPEFSDRHSSVFRWHIFTSCSSLHQGKIFNPVSGFTQYLTANDTTEICSCVHIWMNSCRAKFRPINS